MSEESLSQETVNRIDRDIIRFKDEAERDKVFIWEAIDKLRNRLPLWATFLFMLLTGIIGWLIALIKMGGLS